MWLTQKLGIAKSTLLLALLFLQAICRGVHGVPLACGDQIHQVHFKSRDFSIRPVAYVRVGFWLRNIILHIVCICWDARINDAHQLVDISDNFIHNIQQLR